MRGALPTKERSMQATDQDDKRRSARAADKATAKKPSFFKMRAQMLDKGRTNTALARTENMWATLKVYAAGGIDLERRPHVLGSGERRVGAPLVEHLGAHLEERRLLRRRLVGCTRAAALVVLIGCLHGSLLRRERASHRPARETSRC